ncbi:restriction endonuclease subunit S [Methanomethylophilus alvi]|uniref:restriction endonuclease subunit S n=1 Tax=Methanomethylophilus alvi TaxID=1291540 RepID=UPI0037DC1E63
MAIKGSGSPMETVDEYFDMLIKSRFIEMFGTSTDPKYGLVKIRDLVSNTIEKVAKRYDSEDEIRYIDISSIDKESKSIIGTTDYYVKDAPSRAQQCVIKDDILLSNVRPNLKTLAIVNLEYDNLVCSTGFTVLRCKSACPEYLTTAITDEYFTDKLVKKANGSNYPAVTSKDVLESYVPAASIDLQKQYASFVKQVDKSKAVCKQIFQSLDNLVKSRFIEMFGDPYLSPKYQKMPFMHCLDFNPGKSEVKNVPDDLMVSFVPMDSVGTDGSIDVSKEKTLGEVRKGYTYFRDNDVVFAKITPCFENGKVSIAKKCRNGIGFGTTEFHVARPKEGISNSTWLFYLLRSDSLRMLASGNMSGTAGQKRVQQPFFEKISIGLPPINEQESFASFVKQVDKSKFEVVQSLLRLKSKYMRTETPSKRTDCDL